MDCKKLREQADELFTKRSSLLSLWQQIAENFYPERADFTIRRYLGTDFAENLMTSYPIICRRDLGDQIGTMLRPTAKSWFHMGLAGKEKPDNDGKRWLESAEEAMRRAMYDRVAQFTRAMKEHDHDFATFGQAAVSVEINWKSRKGPHLLYRTHHLRDMAWMEDEAGEICFVARKWNPTCRDLCRIFGDSQVHAEVTKMRDKTPFETVECYHIVCDADMYDGEAGGRPRFSIYYDAKNDKLMQAVPIWGRFYRIPRWQTVSGSQYAFSPATVAALPEGRLLQSMALTLLEAGEKIVNPPMVAQQDVVRSDVALYPGGLTWVDQEYDERLGEALRPLTTDAKGMPLGREMQADSRAILMQCFFLNKLTLPQRAPEMTAYEIGQRVQEYIRGALPLFEPMEMESNGGVCEETFELLMRGGAFGSPLDMPKSLQGADIDFNFESPLHDAVGQQKGQKWLEGKTIIADALALDRSAAALLNTKVGLRDVLESIGYPALWVRSERDVEKAEQDAEAQAQAQQLLASIEQGAAAAESLSVVQKNQAEAGALAA